MTSHRKIDDGLRSLGLDPDDLDPEVLSSIRAAAAKPPKQYTEDDLKRMSPEQIVKAEADGRLDQLLGRKGA